MATVVYFQNPEMCDEQGYWVREESNPPPSRDEMEKTGIGADGVIGGKGWPAEFMVRGGGDRANYWADQFIRQCLGLEGPYRWEYVDILD